MKNVNYVINGVLAIAVLVLFVMQFSGKKDSAASSKTKSSLTGAHSSEFPVAYVNVDSLLLNYNFSKDLNEQIVRKQENARASYTQQARDLEADVQNFQYKMQNGAFASQQRAEQEQQRIIKKQQQLQALDEKLSQELMEESQRINEQLRDTIMMNLREYNKEKGFQIIFSNSGSSTGTILLADDVYNVTNEVIEYLNKRWSSNTN